jgi:predicted MPP superfamily phosphohydrolase
MTAISQPNVLPSLSRRQFLATSTLGGITLAGTGYSTLIEPNRIAIERRTIRISRLSSRLDGLRLVLMSDFHLEPITKLPHLRAAAAIATSLRPDLVMLTGDFVDSRAESIYDLAPLLASIPSRFGTFAVLGNHDYWRGGALVAGALRQEGIHLLENEGVMLSIQGAPLFVAGLRSAWASRPNLPQALETHRGDTPVILLAHEPDYADTVRADSRVALQLSGHSHGGQIRLPGIGALRLPSWGKKYDHGLYQLDSLTLYTNRGIGVVSVPVRFNCPPEITELTLVGS